MSAPLKVTLAKFRSSCSATWLQYGVEDDDTVEGNEVECARAPVRVPFLGMVTSLCLVESVV